MKLFIDKNCCEYGSLYGSFIYVSKEMDHFFSGEGIELNAIKTKDELLDTMDRLIPSSTTARISDIVCRLSNDEALADFDCLLHDYMQKIDTENNMGQNYQGMNCIVMPDNGLLVFYEDKETILDLKRDTLKAFAKYHGVSFLNTLMYKKLENLNVK